MKIIAIGRNYVSHVKELNDNVPAEPVIFLKPDTAVLKDNRPFYIPDFSANIHYELQLTLKIDKEGKHILEKFASDYYQEIGLGIDFTARDIQNKHQEKGLPWELAKAFDNSAVVSNFLPKTDFEDIKNLQFELNINGETRQKGNTKNLIFNFEQIIAYASKFFTLKKGDLIFTGAPQGAGQIYRGDKLEGWLMDKQLLNFNIR